MYIFSFSYFLPKEVELYLVYFFFNQGMVFCSGEKKQTSAENFYKDGAIAIVFHLDYNDSIMLKYVVGNNYDLLSMIRLFCCVKNSSSLPRVVFLKANDSS